MEDIVRFIGENGNILVMFLILLFSLCFHEFAHAWVALKRGDRTAEMMGRLTMNPVAHIDILGTVIFPLTAMLSHMPFIGWAKPVPVIERNLKNPRVDMFWVAFAGPLSNVFLALMGAVLMVLLEIFGRSLTSGLSLQKMVTLFIVTNMFLAFFNMIPIHPLDGGKVLARFLPQHVNERLESIQMYSGIILVVVLLSGGSRFVFLPALWAATHLTAIAQTIGSMVVS